MNIENLDINYAIEFLNSVGYSWDGSIVGNNEKPKTIYDFFYPQDILLINSENNEELVGLQLYDECTDLPYFSLYKKHEVNSYTEMLNFTEQWTTFLKNKQI